MPDKPSFETPIQRLHAATCYASNQELAEVLFVSEASVAETLEHEVIPERWLLTLLREYRLNPLWILNGVGPVFVRDLPVLSPLRTYSTEHLLFELLLRARRSKEKNLGELDLL